METIGRVARMEAAQGSTSACGIRAWALGLCVPYSVQLCFVTMGKVSRKG